MQNAFQPHSILYRFTLLSGCVLAGLLMTGCAEKAPRLEARVASPVGQPGSCTHCDKKIENVTQEQLVIIEGIRYVVCNEKCVADLREWLAMQ